MKKLKQKINSKKSLIILSVIFSLLFFLKASLYSLIGGPFVFDWLEKFIPANIIFYVSMPIYFIFEFPIIWVMERLALLFFINNSFIAFLLDIGLTIIYLALLYWIFSKLYHLLKNRKKSI